MTMFVHRWPLFLLTLECIMKEGRSMFNQSLDERRRCAFQVKEQDRKYLAAGTVNDSVQFCEHTQCCVGYFFVVHGQLVVDTQACNVMEQSCPDAICKAQPRFNNRLVKCVCSTDLCNRNVTWPEAPEKDETLHIIFITLPVLFLMIAALLWRCFSAHKKKAKADPHIAPVSYSHTTQTPQIDVTDVQLQQIVGRGHFATVWQGTYKGSTVAAKVFPATAQCAFTSEKEIYEHPLVRHAGIIGFLGTGRRSEDGSCLLLLQFAEYGSLHSFLNQNTCSWPEALKLCLSLSQGLSYLHTQDGHKPPVAHRDLSSFNVLVQTNGTCALCDFGSSIILPWGHRRTGMAMRYSEAVCTLRYMPPEILEGAVDLTVNFFLHGDIYALSLVLWEICMRCSDLFEGERH